MHLLLFPYPTHLTTTACCGPAYYVRVVRVINAKQLITSQNFNLSNDEICYQLCNDTVLTVSPPTSRFRHLSETTLKPTETLDTSEDSSDKIEMNVICECYRSDNLLGFVTYREHVVGLYIISSNAATSVTVVKLIIL
jgi:hypothetical protein